MKTLFLILTLLSVAYCGHIMVEDPVLKWQNYDEFMEIRLRFALESGSSATTILEITWPFSPSSSVYVDLLEGGITK